MFIRLKKSRIVVVTITAIVIVFAVSVISAFAEEAVVPDENLRAALDTNRDGQATQEEIEALTGVLDLHSKGISDISGLEHVIGVTSINLQGNKIKDIQPLLTLVGTTPHSVTGIDLSHNYLTGDSINRLVAVLGEYNEAANTGVHFEPQDAIRVESVALSPELLLGVDETAVLTASLVPDDAADKNLTWASSDVNVVTVENGTVKGVGPGTAIITAASVQNSGATAACTVTVKNFHINSAAYSIDRSQGILKGVPKTTALGDFLNNISNDNSELAVFDAAGNLCADTTIKTGMIVKLNVGGAEREALKIAVAGDSNGDGMVTVSDYTLARLDILGLKSLTDVYRIASDVNGDGKISIADYTMIRIEILGIKSPGSGPDLPAVSDSRIRSFLDVALQQQGKPYVWSAEGPDSFDCSGYVWYCLRQIGYKVGRTTANSYSLKSDWPYVPRDQLQPGDLMFYHSDSKPGIIGHIGIYLGNGYHIHASSDNNRVIISRIEGWYDRMLSHGRRVFN